MTTGLTFLLAGLYGLLLYHVHIPLWSWEFWAFLTLFGLYRFVGVIEVVLEEKKDKQ